ncbi:MAG: hypothetical protein Q8S05_09705 [Sulfuricella sp.]|nr:hypothetical protein [Sulfuricella sp.]
MLRQCPAQTCLHCIVTLTGKLNGAILQSIDNIKVVSRSALHRINARIAIDTVIAGVTRQDIVQIVTGRIDVARARKREIFDKVRKRMTHRRENNILSCIFGLGNGISSAVDDIGIVARSTRHGIQARFSIQNVRLVVASHDVVMEIARASDGCASEHQIFNVYAQCMIDARLHGIDT